MNILIVEDDKALNSGILLALKNPADHFVQCFRLDEAIDAYKKEKAEMIILDVNLPDGSGYDLLARVRAESDIPVLMLTANDLETDEVTGLSLGADDYMTKPFSLAVLRARIEALKRRSGRSEKEKKIYQIDDFVFDYEKLLFTCKGKEMSLSRNEQKLLKLFLENKGQVLTRELLLDRLWTDGAEYVDENALSVTVNRLRKKLGTGTQDFGYIQTVYGQGYIWKRNDR